MRTGHPVRSAILKHQIGRSVVGWVTTSESLLLYVIHCFAFLYASPSFLPIIFNRLKVEYAEPMAFSGGEVGLGLHVDH